MTIVRVQHIGIAVKDFQGTLNKFEKVYGLKARDFRDDQGKGMQHDSRILLGNDCWIHIVHNWDPNSRVYQFVENVDPQRSMSLFEPVSDHWVGSQNVLGLK